MVWALEIPSRREVWQLLERLGKGGSAEAWRARRAGSLLCDEVCVKLPLRAYDAAERREVLEEAHVLSRVRHANVVSLLDVVEDAGQRPVLVLELVRGTDLDRLSRALRATDRLLPPEVVASVGRALCLAIAAAQRAIEGGLAHRDITPHNILVSREGEVKLADFGIARVLGRGSWTASGRVKGKLGYVAPEVVRGEQCDVASDVFSLGVVLHEQLLGFRPFAGRDVLESLESISRGRRTRAAPRRATTPEGLLGIIEWMLSHERNGRPGPDAAARALSSFGYEQRANEFLAEAVRRLRGPGIARAQPRDGQERTRTG